MIMEPRVSIYPFTLCSGDKQRTDSHHNLLCTKQNNLVLDTGPLGVNSDSIAYQFCVTAIKPLRSLLSLLSYLRFFFFFGF